MTTNEHSSDKHKTNAVVWTRGNAGRDFVLLLDVDTLTGIEVVVYAWPVTPERADGFVASVCGFSSEKTDAELWQPEPSRWWIVEAYGTPIARLQLADFITAVGFADRLETALNPLAAPLRSVAVRRVFGADSLDVDAFRPGITHAVLRRVATGYGKTKNGAEHIGSMLCRIGAERTSACVP